MLGAHGALCVMLGIPYGALRIAGEQGELD